MAERLIDTWRGSIPVKFANQTVTTRRTAPEKRGNGGFDSHRGGSIVLFRECPISVAVSKVSIQCFMAIRPASLPDHPHSHCSSKSRASAASKLFTRKCSHQRVAGARTFEPGIRERTFPRWNSILIFSCAELRRMQGCRTYLRVPSGFSIGALEFCPELVHPGPYDAGTWRVLGCR